VDAYIAHYAQEYIPARLKWVVIPKRKVKKRIKLDRWAIKIYPNEVTRV